MVAVAADSGGVMLAYWTSVRRWRSPRRSGSTCAWSASWAWTARRDASGRLIALRPAWSSPTPCSRATLRAASPWRRLAGGGLRGAGVTRARARRRRGCARGHAPSGGELLRRRPACGPTSASASCCSPRAPPAGRRGERPRDALTHPAQRLDDTVHQRVRLGVLAVLGRGQARGLRLPADALELTDGNLSRHIAVLEQAGPRRGREGLRGPAPADLGPGDGRRAPRAEGRDAGAAGADLARSTPAHVGCRP